ncbi:MAG: site-2 protease family protein [Tepidisphaeraceae bacterium]
MTLSGILYLIVMVVGFGFVVFWHELGHFLAAKWAGVKVDQFAVGFGRALLCWRKGIGVTVGTSAKEYEKRAVAHYQKTTNEQSMPTMVQIDAAAREIGLGETEYRLNWIPLGGYVKMLGQDDMDPTHQSADPRAFNNKSVGARMVIISAGVVMNVILAGILFTVLFMYGFTVPQAKIGLLMPGSPAQQAGLQVGDRITEIYGHPISDFSKISFNVALLPDAPVSVKFERDGKPMELQVHPKASAATMGMLGMGIGPSPLLKAVDKSDLDMDAFEKLPPSMKIIRPGDTITAIEGQPVTDAERFDVLDTAMQNSGGKPVALTVRDANGQTRQEQIHVRFAALFGGTPLQFGGMAPRATSKTFSRSRRSKTRSSRATCC